MKKYILLLAVISFIGCESTIEEKSAGYDRNGSSYNLGSD